MNFEDEHYVRIFTRDTKTWMRWGWEGQTVFMHLMRRLDKAGVLDDIQDPVPDVALLTGLPEDVVAVGLPRLFASETIQLINHVLVAPRYIEGQTAKRSDVVRAKESRERRRQTVMLSQIVTKRHESEPPVTLRDEPERNRSPRPPVTDCDGTITNRDRSSQIVTKRHANPAARHSVQSNAEHYRSDPKADDATLKTRQVPSSAQPPSAAAAPPEVFDLPIDEPPRTQREIPKPEPQTQTQTQPDNWRPRNRQEALDAPIAQRAAWAVREQWAAAEYSPQAWPEVVQVAQAFHAAYKLAPPKLLRLDQDRAVQRIIALLAHYTPAQLVAVCQALPKSKWSLDLVGQGKRAQLTWLSPEVVRTQFSDLPSEREVSPKVLRAIQAAGGDR